jgi:glycosyltransferase involved in cell wall biosynthesis
MLHGKKVVVVLPAYKAEATLERTYSEIPYEIVNEVLLVDDASNDGTARLAAKLGIETFVHESNLGYGANQKTCYARALAAGADIIVMVHPDYQYDPRLITAMAAMVASDVYDVVLGSRILGNTARRGGMPLYKFVANRILTPRRSGARRRKGWSSRMREDAGRTGRATRARWRSVPARPGSSRRGPRRGRALCRWGASAQRAYRPG